MSYRKEIMSLRPASETSEALLAAIEAARAKLAWFDNEAVGMKRRRGELLMNGTERQLADADVALRSVEDGKNDADELLRQMLEKLPQVQKREEEKLETIAKLRIEASRKAEIFVENWSEYPQLAGRIAGILRSYEDARGAENRLQSAVQDFAPKPGDQPSRTYLELVSSKPSCRTVDAWPDGEPPRHPISELVRLPGAYGEPYSNRTPGHPEPFWWTHAQRLHGMGH